MKTLRRRRPKILSAIRSSVDLAQLHDVARRSWRSYCVARAVYHAQKGRRLQAQSYADLAHLVRALKPAEAERINRRLRRCEQREVWQQ